MPERGDSGSMTTKEYWRKIVGEHKASGQSVRRYCQEQGVGTISFYGWRKRLSEREPVRFAVIEAGSVGIGAQPELELVLVNGERLRIGSGVNPARLRTVLEALRP